MLKTHEIGARPVHQGRNTSFDLSRFVLARSLNSTPLSSTSRLALPFHCCEMADSARDRYLASRL